jgi:hypothetical protein
MIKKDEYLAAIKDERLKPLHERPYTPGEHWIIGPADPPGAPISGNPTRQDTDKAHDQHP